MNIHLYNLGAIDLHGYRVIITVDLFSSPHRTEYLFIGSLQC